MRYSIELEKAVKQAIKEGKSINEVSRLFDIPKKMIYRWCPELQSSEEQLRISVKQRFHSILPIYEAKISSYVSPYVKDNVSDDEWESINKKIATLLFEQTVFTYKAALKYNLNENDSLLPNICLSDENFITYLKRFWNYNKSEYISERKKKGLSLKIEYVRQSYNYIKYWEELYSDRKLCELTLNDVLFLKAILVQKGFSSSKINFILHSGVTALKFAFQKSLTSNDCFSGLSYLPKSKSEQFIIDESVIEDLFTQKWRNREAYIANLTAYITGLKYCELVALRLSDLTDNSIKVRHIYSNGLKDCKKKNIRDLIVPKKLILMLRDYASTSPYKKDSSGFIFYGLDKNKPLECRFFTEELKEKLNELGLSSNEISFSLWHNIYNNRTKRYLSDCSTNID